MHENGIEFDYCPTNRVAEDFPWTIDDLKKYDVVVVSDVGSNTFLISQKTMSGERTPNRLKLIEHYVADGGGFLMWGVISHSPDYMERDFIKEFQLRNYFQFL